MRRPNPRVQRTRPCASLRGSPLTRHPLGRRQVAVLHIHGVICRQIVHSSSFDTPTLVA